MARSIWKKPFSQTIVFKSIYNNSDSQKPVMLSSRSSTIFPSFVGITFFVYNEKKFVSLQIHENMVGLKFGDFISTRKKAVHSKK